MNRPFYAFGLLLALLALAMFAVSSSNRPTAGQVQPPAPAGNQLPATARLGSIYVVVLPAAEVPIQVADPLEPPTAAETISELKPALSR